MTIVIKVTTDEELDEHFEGVMIPVEDIAGKYRVPGWKCKHCGWTVGTKGYPPTHGCPDEGQVQALLRQDRTLTRIQAQDIVKGLTDLEEGRTEPIENLWGNGDET